MTRKHAHPLYKRNARLRRAQVHAAWRQGLEVICRSCGGLIHPGQRFDIGHIDPDGGHALDNLGIEHVRCNRSHGGRIGAALTNSRRTPTTGQVTTWSL